MILQSWAPYGEKRRMSAHDRRPSCVDTRQETLVGGAGPASPTVVRTSTTSRKYPHSVTHNNRPRLACG